MKEEEECTIYQKGVVEGMKHSKPSPETAKKLAILETNFENINDDLKEIKTAITRSTIWLITTLFTILIASFSLAFWLGTWKGSIEEKMNNLQKEHEKTVLELKSTKDSVRGIAKEEVDNFAKRNFDEYYR